MKQRDPVKARAIAMKSYRKHREAVLARRRARFVIKEVGNRTVRVVTIEPFKDTPVKKKPKKC